MVWRSATCAKSDRIIRSRRRGGFDARMSQVVELRFFGGLTVTETAQVLNVSPETVMRDWRTAKAWLLREIKRGQPTASS